MLFKIREMLNYSKNRGDFECILLDLSLVRSKSAPFFKGICDSTSCHSLAGS
jgi:hypothetical protein